MFGATECQECEKNTIASAYNQSRCTPCTAGRTSSGRAGTTCTEVPAGSYVNASDVIVPCDPGYMCKGKDKGRTACLRGAYASNPGSVDCFPCSPGKFARHAASVKCTVCPSGWLQEDEGQPNCTKPRPGTIAAGRSASVPIAEGWTASNCSENGVCRAAQPCVPGRFDSGSHTCVSCPAGWSSTEGKSSCDVCDKGKYAKLGGGVCEDCPGGWFQDQNVKASVACRACPSGYGAVKGAAGEPVNGSALCRNLNFVTRCSSEQYLNDTSDDPGDHTCEPCPPGGACIETTAAWSRLGPLFGWWKVPEEDHIRAGSNASWKSTVAFVKCFYSPACLGAPNRALEKRHFTEDGVDLAMVGRGNVSTTCATSLGFRNRSRLCHSCNTTSRRQSNSQCTKCPSGTQNWGLISLGFLVALLILCFVVSGAIEDAGAETLSSAVLKISLNYLQGECFGFFSIRDPHNNLVFS